MLWFIIEVLLNAAIIYAAYAVYQDYGNIIYAIAYAILGFSLFDMAIYAFSKDPSPRELFVAFVRAIAALSVIGLIFLLIWTAIRG